MQGSGISSNSIWTPFDATTTAFKRVLKHLLKVSWNRVEDPDAGFAVVGTSVVDGTDIVKGEQSVITSLDTFEYFDETDRAIALTYDRQLQEPLGGIHTALFDTVLDNHDGRFTPDQNGTIGTAILPNRPVNAGIGFEVQSQNKIITLFKGLTKKPKDMYGSRTATFTAVDYVSFLLDYRMDSASYSGQRTDEIIEDILTTIGFGSTQYDLDTGFNTIGYAYFDKTQTAGQRIAKLCESEGGVFYQDETGILRFKNRVTNRLQYFQNTLWTFELSSILDWEEDNSAPIYNSVTVKAKPRIVQSTQEIWRDGIEEEIEAGETITVWASLDDPANSIENIASTTDYTAYTGSGGTGSDITADISIVQTKFAQACKLEITNNNANKAYMNLLKLRGDPAVVQGDILEIVEDSDSINKYGEQPLVIENDFIDKRSVANTLAQDIIDDYASTNRKLILTVRGVPQIQLWDKVKVYDRRKADYLYMRITRIQGDMIDGLFTQRLYLRERDPDTFPFVVGTNSIDQTQYLVY